MLSNFVYSMGATPKVNLTFSAFIGWACALKLRALASYRCEDQLVRLTPLPRSHRALSGSRICQCRETNVSTSGRWSTLNSQLKFCPRQSLLSPCRKLCQFKHTSNSPSHKRSYLKIHCRKSKICWWWYSSGQHESKEVFNPRSWPKKGINLFFQLKTIFSNPIWMTLRNLQ